MRTLFQITLLVALAGMAAHAQHGAERGEPTLPDLKTTPLAKLIGRWEGESRVTVPGMAEPQTVRMVESAQWKLGGSAVLVEGRGTRVDPDTNEEVVVHDAIGIMRFDPRTRTLRSIAMRANEPAVDSELEVLESGEMRWFMEPAPGRKIRFTITLTENTWKEVGEFSPDGGQTWRKVMEMNLQRVATE